MTPSLYLVTLASGLLVGAVLGAVALVQGFGLLARGEETTGRQQAIGLGLLLSGMACIGLVAKFIPLVWAVWRGYG